MADGPAALRVMAGEAPDDWAAPVVTDPRKPRLLDVGRRILARDRFAPDSPLEGDGFELPVREHRAMAPSHGFAAASHREAALRGAPASHGETAFRGAAGFREAPRRHAVHPSRNAVPPCRPPAIGPRGAPPCGPPLRNPAGRKPDIAIRQP